MIQSTQLWKTSQNVDIREITCFLILWYLPFLSLGIYICSMIQKKATDLTGYFALQEAVVYSYPRRQIQMKILIWKSNTGIAKVLIPSVLIPDLSCWPYIWHTKIVCSPEGQNHTLPQLFLWEFHWLWAFPKEPGSGLLDLLTVAFSLVMMRQRVEHKVCQAWGKYTMFTEKRLSMF